METTNQEKKKHMPKAPYKKKNPIVPFSQNILKTIIGQERAELALMMIQNRNKSLLSMQQFPQNLTLSRIRSANNRRNRNLESKEQWRNRRDLQVEAEVHQGFPWEGEDQQQGY